MRGLNLRCLSYIRILSLSRVWSSGSKVLKIGKITLCCFSRSSACSNSGGSCGRSSWNSLSANQFLKKCLILLFRASIRRSRTQPVFFINRSTFLPSRKCLALRLIVFVKIGCRHFSKSRLKVCVRFYGLSYNEPVPVDSRPSPNCTRYNLAYHGLIPFFLAMK